LASALTVGRVDAERLWYPPARPWNGRVSPSRGPRSAAKTFNEDFDASYEFFASARGGALAGNPGPMIALPAATNASQHLPIPGAQ
jgi:hypothetical protein